MDELHTRQTLLLRAKDQNDEAAWSDFIEYYQGFITMLLQKLSVPVDEQADLSQEILLEIWSAMQKFELDHTKARFRSWLSAVIRHTVYDYMKSQRARNQREARSGEEDNFYNLFREKTSDLDQMIDKEWAGYMANRVLEHLRQFFSGKAIDVFILSSEGKSTAEISRELDIPSNTVYVLRNRIKGRFMSEMKTLRNLIEF